MQLSLSWRLRIVLRATFFWFLFLLIPVGILTTLAVFECRFSNPECDQVRTGLHYGAVYLFPALMVIFLSLFYSISTGSIVYALLLWSLLYVGFITALQYFVLNLFFEPTIVLLSFCGFGILFVGYLFRFSHRLKTEESAGNGTEKRSRTRRLFESGVLLLFIGMSAVLLYQIFFNWVNVPQLLSKETGDTSFCYWHRDEVRVGGCLSITAIERESIKMCEEHTVCRYQYAVHFEECEILSGDTAKEERYHSLCLQETRLLEAEDLMRICIETGKFCKNN